MFARNAVLTVLLMVTTAACAADSGDSAGTPASTAAAAPPATAAAPGATAPTGTAADVAVPDRLRFTAETTGGQRFDGEALAGKNVVLWFWAPWCTQCRREAPHLAAAQARFGQDVTFVGVAALGPVSDMRSFITETDVGGFPHLADVDGKLWKRFGVTRQPAYAFIDQSGATRVVRGELGPDKLADEVRDLTGA